MSDYGTVEYNGKTLTLTQDAYLDHDRHNLQLPVYRAHAVDEDGNDYRVQWHVVDGWQEMDDESDRCDWDDYQVFEA